MHNFAQLLAEQQSAAVLPQLFREAWAFSACISLATTTSRLMGVAAVLNKQLSSQPASPVKPPQQAYRYSTRLPCQRRLCSLQTQIELQELYDSPNDEQAID